MKIKGLLCATAVLGLLAACERPEILAGERFDTRADLAEVMATTDGSAGTPAPANRAVPITLGAAQANGEWSHRGGSAARNMPHLALSAQPKLIWSSDIGRGDSRRARIATAPIVVGGKVFAMDAANRLTALSATSGAQLWQIDVTARGERSGAIAGGGLAYGAGQLFVTTSYGELLAVSPQTGAVQWRQRFDGPVSGAPTVLGGTVFVAGRDGAGWGVTAATGKLAWTQPGVRQTSGILGGTSPAAAGNTVVMPYSAGQLIGLEATSGQGKWMAAVAGERPGRSVALLPEMTGDPVIANGRVYAGSSAGRTVALDLATGAELWSAREGAMGPVWPVGNAVYLVSDEGRLVRLEAGSGQVVWSVPMGHFTDTRAKKLRDVVGHYGPVLAGGRLVVASTDGLIRFFAPDSGAPLGSLAVKGGAAAAPAVAGGILYVVTSDGQVQAFR